MKLFLVAALGVPPMLFGMTAVSGEEAFQVRTERTSNELALEVNGAPVFVYRYEEVPRKPYLKEWYTPGGLNILRDAPMDHLHHHGLMFAIKADEVNFWEEWDNTGYQVHGELLDVCVSGNPGKFSAGFVHELAWRGPDSDEPILNERRSISHSKLSGASVLTWQSTLRPANPNGAAPVMLGGNIYHGLGMRFPEFMDRAGTFIMAEDKAGAFDDGAHHHLARARWCAYSVAHDDHPVTVAMFHCPDNPRATLWFTMREPFAYLSATQDLMRAPMELPAGGEVSFRHGVAVWDAVVDEAEIEGMYRAWLESLR